MRTKTISGLVAALLIFAMSGVAFAGSGASSSLSIGYSPSSGGSFAGKLRAPQGCVGGRKVVVFRKSSGSDTAVGNGNSSPNGAWSAKAGRITAGDYYAKTKSVTLKSGTKCASAKSPSTHVS